MRSSSKLDIDAKNGGSAGTPDNWGQATPVGRVANSSETPRRWARAAGGDDDAPAIDDGLGFGEDAPDDFSQPEYDIHDAKAFQLQPLSSLRFILESNTVADMTVAENAIWDMNQRETAAGWETYADAMLNIEALASVRMDGRPPSARDIFFERAELSNKQAEPPDHIVRYERDRASLVHALELAEAGATVDMFCDIHRRVLPPKNSAAGGQLRTGMKQVGGSRYHTFGTAYVMPRPEEVRPLLEDLAAFLNDDEQPVIEQAGIAHAQLVNIHPFERGNGKMARMMVHHSLRYRGIAKRYLLPITCEIVNSNHDYVAGIDGCKISGSESEEEVNERVNDWLSYFASICLRSAGMSSAFIMTCDSFVRRALGKAHVRAGSAAQRLIKALPALPVFTVRMVEEYLDCSFKRASEACKTLERAGVIALRDQVKRNRIYYSSDILDKYLTIDALR